LIFPSLFSSLPVLLNYVFNLACFAEVKCKLSVMMGVSLFFVNILLQYFFPT